MPNPINKIRNIKMKTLNTPRKQELFVAAPIIPIIPTKIKRPAKTETAMTLCFPISSAFSYGIAW